MRVRTKLILLFCITLLGYLLGFGVDRVGQRMLEDADVLEKAAIDAYLNVLQMRRYEKNFFLRNNTGYVESARTYRLKASGKLKEIVERDPTSEERSRKAQTLLDEYWRSFEAVVELEIARGLAPSIGLLNEFIEKSNSLGGLFYALAGKELLKGLLVVSQLSSSYLSQSDERTLQELRLSLVALDNAIKEDPQLLDHAKDMLRQAVAAFLGSVNQLGGLDEVKLARDRDFVKAARELEPVVIELRRHYEEQRGLTASRANKLLLLVQSLTVGFVSLVVVWTLFSIARQLRAIQTFANLVASGDLNAVAEGEIGGEFGELNANIAHMVDRLKRMLEGLRQKEEEALREAARATAAMRKAEAASKLKSDFLSLVSHELRTPLTSVYGFAKIVEKKVKTFLGPLAVESKTRRAYEQICENLAVILSEGEHLSVMINNVLDMTELEASATEWRQDPVPMAEAIQAALASLSSVIEQTSLLVVCDFAPDLPLVRGDKDRLTQVVRNLLSNALKFAEQGEVHVSCERQGEEVVTCVADSGPGVPVDLQEEIFEKFRQGGDALTGKPAGLGLGLAICKEILKVHGGRIWVESRPNAGSKFFFALPAAACDLEQGKVSEDRA